MAPPSIEHQLLLLEARDALSLVFGPAEVQSLMAAGEAIQDPYRQAFFFRDLLADVDARLSGEVPEALDMRDEYLLRPVDVREFVNSPYYLNKAEEIYPKVLDELEEMNSGKYIEIVHTGSIGCAKTTTALYTNAYQLYLLSCLRNPHKLYGLDTASEILLVFQSLTEKLARGVDYNRFKAMIHGSPYFINKFPFDRNIDSKLVFPHRIEVTPVSGSNTAAIGQNVMGGLIDEMNFMAMVEKSKQSVDRGTYDQAVEVYNSISRRRKSRFMKQGKLPGVLCLVSSKKYPGQFTDLKEAESKEEIRRTGKTSIYIYDKRSWDVAPEGKFSGRWFKIFIGDEGRKPRILEPEEVFPPEDQRLIMDIPEEYRGEFERDPMNSLRDIAGVSTLALFPFFQSREDVAEAFEQHQSILTLEETDFVSPPLQVLHQQFFKPELPRWIHIDLSVSRDATGVACGCVPGFTSISRGDGFDDQETMPQVRLDFLLRVVAPKGGEILFYKIRTLIYLLRQKGLNIKWVSFDSYQSIDMQQVLRQNNFVTGEVSMDTSTLPYEMLKSAIYDQRVSAPAHAHCEKELVSLEMDSKQKKVDHPPNGSKDVADALAGVVYGLTMRREIWNMFDVPIVRLPGELQALMDRERERMKEEGNFAGMMR